MNDKKTSLIYRFLKAIVRLVYPKPEILGAETLPEEPVVVVANHSQMNGPLVGELYYPRPREIWCASEMMTLREVPAYAYRDFWSGKPKAVRWFFRLSSYLIAPIAVCVFNNAHCIGVHRDRRVLETFRASLAALENGEDILIFPERAEPMNNILCAFQEGFVDLARQWYRRTGRTLRFVPMYIAPALKQAVIGSPVPFDPAAPIRQERERICQTLAEEITAMARALPEHRVVPYLNLPKKDYPLNTQYEEAQDEASSL